MVDFFPSLTLTSMHTHHTCISFISQCSIVVVWSTCYVNGFGDHWFVGYKWNISKAIDTGYNKNWYLLKSLNRLHLINPQYHKRLFLAL